MQYIPSKRRFSLAVLILTAGIFLFATSCSNTRYYNRYNKDKACKMEDQGAKKARKNK
ncbi:MAG: hypothetical protein JXA23_06770 [Bacteroidales bacterium]|nr:hypothetical protein [Bacteroidales bacterium]